MELGENQPPGRDRPEPCECPFLLKKSTFQLNNIDLTKGTMATRLVFHENGNDTPGVELKKVFLYYDNRSPGFKSRQFHHHDSGSFCWITADAGGVYQDGKEERVALSDIRAVRAGKNAIKYSSMQLTLASRSIALVTPTTSYIFVATDREQCKTWLEIMRTVFATVKQIKKSTKALSALSWAYSGTVAAALIPDNYGMLTQTPATVFCAEQKDEAEVDEEGQPKIRLYLYCCGGLSEPTPKNPPIEDKTYVDHQEYLLSNSGVPISCWKVCLSRLVDIKLGAPSHLAIANEGELSNENCFSITTLDRMLHLQTDTGRSCTKWVVEIASLLKSMIERKMNPVNVDDDNNESLLDVRRAKNKRRQKKLCKKSNCNVLPTILESPDRQLIPSQNIPLQNSSSHPPFGLSSSLSSVLPPSNSPITLQDHFHLLDDDQYNQENYPVDLNSVRSVTTKTNSPKRPSSESADADKPLKYHKVISNENDTSIHSNIGVSVKKDKLSLGTALTKLFNRKKTKA